jgi:uncharacterized SAM-binding protein YcdF (DUF218 family)
MNSPGAPRRRRRLRFWILAATPLLLWVSSTLWLPSIGSALISAEAPVRCDIAVVLAGDSSGQRVLRAAELVKENFAPKVVVSGPMLFYGMGEDQLAIPFAVRQGYPAAYFEGFPMVAYSTKDEARILLDALRRRGVGSILLVTSDYHTGRAGRIWRSLAGGIRIHVVAAPDPFFKADSWWKNREAQKRVFTEWVKTVTTPFGI